MNGDPRTDNPTTAPGGGLDGAEDAGARLDRVAVLCRTANHFRRYLETTVLHRANLTWSSYDVLHLTVMHRPIDTGVLARLASVSTGTVTRAAADLENRRLLRRSRPSADRRRRVLAPTPAGWELNHQLRGELITELNRLLDTTAPHTGAVAVLQHFTAGYLATPAYDRTEHPS